MVAVAGFEPDHQGMNLACSLYTTPLREKAKSPRGFHLAGCFLRT